MSHAYGRVYKDGKVIGHFEYNGTADFCVSDICESVEEVTAKWRTDHERECTCGQTPLDVILYTDYGYGFHWPGQVCMECRAIVGGLEPYGDDFDTVRGLPPGAIDDDA